VRYSKKVDEANIRIIDLKLAVLDEIEPLVDEDRYKFNLAQNSRLLKNFIFYRLSDFVLKTMENSVGTKVVFYITPDFNLTVLQEYSNYTRAAFVQIASVLALNVMIGKTHTSQFLATLISQSGEGKEARNRLHFTLNRTKNPPNLPRFNKLLRKYNIHKLEGDINNNYKVKLGLFVA